MLTYNPEERITAIDAFANPWIQSKEFQDLNEIKTKELMSNMGKFVVRFLAMLKILQSSVKLQQAAMMFIVSQLMTKKEKDELAQIFMALDKNGDGSLTQQELLEGYNKLYKNQERARSEVKYLMEIADTDNNGTIDYSGT